MGALGLDLAPERARHLTPELIRSLELILAMEAGQHRAVEAIHQSVRERVRQLGRMGGFDLPDRDRQGCAAFERSLVLMEPRPRRHREGLLEQAAVKTPLVVALSLLSGCALAPRMQMDEAAAEARGRARGKDSNCKVEPVTPDLITRLSEQSAKDYAPVPDPQGKVPPPPYTIAPYDVLQVTVWDHPALTAPTGGFRSPEENGISVQEDGTTYYPHVGVIHVAGKRLPEVRAILTEKLAHDIMKPQLDVRIAAFRRKRVQVTGEVIAPVTMPLTDVPLLVQDAIAFAKGFIAEGPVPGPAVGADPPNVTHTRDGKTHRLDLLAFYEGGDHSQKWLLKDGDVINVGDRNHRNRIFVMGEVKQQQAKLMAKRRMTLAEAIGDSGGIDPVASAVGKIYVIRGDVNAPSIYRLDASSADALLLATQFQLRPKESCTWRRTT
jgi:polysaccharide export outer membrane protein